MELITNKLINILNNSNFTLLVKSLEGKTHDNIFLISPLINSLLFEFKAIFTINIKSSLLQISL